MAKKLDNKVDMGYTGPEAMCPGKQGHASMSPCEKKLDKGMGMAYHGECSMWMVSVELAQVYLSTWK